MRENRPYGSEGGEGQPFPTPISSLGSGRQCHRIDMDDGRTSALEADDRMAVLDRERQVAEELAAPAVEEGNVGLIIERQGLDIGRACDELGGDAMALADDLERELEDFGSGLRSFGHDFAARFELWQRLRIDRKPGLYRLEQGFAVARAGKT